MKLNKFMMSIIISFGVYSQANAADGTVTFTGSITATPCSINPDSVDQTVPLGTIAKHVLDSGGTSVPRQFDIKLEQCDITMLTGPTVTTTFNGVAGPTSPTGLLGIYGTARGASVAITDIASNPIPLGTASLAQTLVDGSNTLRFTAYLQGDNSATNPVTPGDFTAVTDFVLNYL